jgi:hypothetical protein
MLPRVEAVPWERSRLVNVHMCVIGRRARSRGSGAREPEPEPGRSLSSVWPSRLSVVGCTVARSAPAATPTGLRAILLTSHTMDGPRPSSENPSETEWTPCQPQPVRAPAAPPCRSSTSLPPANGVPPDPAASRNPMCAAGLTRGQRATTLPNDTSVRLAPPAPSRAAADTWRASPRLRRPSSPLQHKLHAPSPVASLDAQVREGPGAAVGSALSSFVDDCAALGPDAASCSLSSSCVHACAATGAHAV